jgi:choline dehydrogenase
VNGGPITVVNAKDAGNPVSQVFLDACVELGYPAVDDFNASAFGCGWHHVDLRVCAETSGGIAELS